ncbi:hypothetical protein B0T18DRAFT_249664 [Schizothecium vesticola]|uniref:Uncharacterized protein n=1 Tax=Schizothecium vesticola TaxID=314040 RepID=A0AA40EIK2_9PEZI|nr:hypothetical protein B0T18DRAFT_249664 [Schizothecium vesticola]
MGPTKPDKPASQPASQPVRHPTLASLSLLLAPSSPSPISQQTLGLEGNPTHQPGSARPPTPHSLPQVHEQGKRSRQRTSLDDRISTPSPSMSSIRPPRSIEPCTIPRTTCPIITNLQPNSAEPREEPNTKHLQRPSHHHPSRPQSTPRVFPPPTWMEPRPRLRRTNGLPLCRW